MARIPVPFGGGLDRETGVMVAPPGGFECLKNVILFEGKAVVRRGFSLVASYTYQGSPVDSIIGLWPVRAEGSTIVAAMTTDRKVVLYRAAPDGSGPRPLNYQPPSGDPLGTVLRDYWFIAPAGYPPVIHGADSYGKLYLAHDDIYGRRQPTIKYDLTIPYLAPITADLDGTGAKPVYFRGVVRHLAYLMGWGFGTASQPDRPEVVRTSKPSEPDTFLPEHYWIAGQRQEPVLLCVSLGSTLVVLKETDSYEIFGYSRENFGIKPLDPLRGVGSSRLAFAVEGRLFAWGEVPWTWAGGDGGGEEISPPLDMQGADPENLVAAGPRAKAFATYHPRTQCVWFVFGRRVYCLSLRSKPWKWSYLELAFEPTCASLLYTAGTALGVPTGYPEAIAPDDATYPWDLIRSTRVVSKVRHHHSDSQADYGVVLDVFVRENGSTDPWTQFSVLPSITADGAIENVPVPASGSAQALTPATLYDLAFRYRRGAQTTAGYESDDPTEWTADTADDSKTQFTTADSEREWNGWPVWSRTAAAAEQVALSWGGGDEGVGTEIWRSINGAAYALVQTVAMGVTDYDYPLPGDESESETYLSFKIRSVGATLFTSEQTLWTGPFRPMGDANGDGMFSALEGPYLNVQLIQLDDGNGNFWTDPDNFHLQVDWVNNGNNTEPNDTEVWMATDGVWDVAPISTVIAPATGLVLMNVPTGHAYSVKLRHKQTVDTKEDFSDYTPVNTVNT